jgi:hypothetical protein
MSYTFEELVDEVNRLKTEYITEKHNLWDKYNNGDSNVIVESSITYNGNNKVISDLIFENENIAGSAIYNIKEEYNNLRSENEVDWYNWDDSDELSWIKMSDSRLTEKASASLLYLDNQIVEAIARRDILYLQPTIDPLSLQAQITWYNELIASYVQLIENTGSEARDANYKVPDVENIKEYVSKSSDKIINKDYTRDEETINIGKPNYQYYKSFSGTDAQVHIIFPDDKQILLGTISTISYSILRIKNPVQTLGRISPKGFTKGSRIVAGSLIFTVFNNHWVNEVKEEYPDLFKGINKIKADELPPFDIIVTYANEYGATSYYTIYGLTITEEGQVFSIEDAMTENVCKFVARDIDCNQPTKGSLNGGAKLNWKNTDLMGKFKLDEFIIEEPSIVNDNYDIVSDTEDDNTEPYDPELKVEDNYTVEYNLNIAFNYEKDSNGNSFLLDDQTVNAEVNIEMYDENDELFDTENRGFGITNGILEFNKVLNDILNKDKIWNINIEIKFDVLGHIINELRFAILNEWTATENHNLNTNGQLVLLEVIETGGKKIYNIDYDIFTNMHSDDGNYLLFDDIPSGYWALDSITNMTNAGIISGYPDNTFKPEREISRAEVATLLIKTCSYDQDLTVESYPLSSFLDVPKDHWGYKFIEEANERKIMIGEMNRYQIWYFRPKDTITLQEIVVALVNLRLHYDAMNALQVGINNPAFNTRDIFIHHNDIASWAANYLIYAYQEGWLEAINGQPELLLPKKKATRAEVCNLIHKVFEDEILDLL